MNENFRILPGIERLKRVQDNSVWKRLPPASTYNPIKLSELEFREWLHRVLISGILQKTRSRQKVLEKL